jgi:RNase P subunit RPR2
LILFIERDQASRILGGVKFILKARVQLTRQELELVNKYSVKDEILYQQEIRINFASKATTLTITIRVLLKGTVFKCKSLGAIQKYEVGIKEACAHFVECLELMRTFGGSETIKFTAGETVEPDSDTAEEYDSNLVVVCPDCGSVNEKSDEFCKTCGVPLIWEDSDDS